MYKLEFTLKQHTPLIHFQHDQAGATLRATEVKPKLDFFLMKKLLKKPEIPDHKVREEFYKIAITKLPDGTIHPWKKWLVGKGKNEHMAFDYKLKTYSEGTVTSENINYTPTPDNKWRPSFPFIFGNVETETQWKYLSSSIKIKICFTSFHQELLSTITTFISDFFLQHNFGYRQSKGFGSFYLDENDEAYKKPSAQFHFSINVQNIANEPSLEKYYKEVFYNIELLYKTLRSGINTSKYGGIYFKSMMFMYAKSIGQKWDKKNLRETFYSTHPLYEDIKTTRDRAMTGTVNYNAPNNDMILFRDILGLSTEQDWMGYGPPKLDRDRNVIRRNGQIVYKSDTLTKKSLSNEVERFKSPLIFKPIKRKSDNKYDVYIIINPIPKEYLRQTMLINSKSYPTSTIRMPFLEEFDLNKFLIFCFKTVFQNDIEFNRHITDPTRREAIILREIYKELRNC